MRAHTLPALSGWRWLVEGFTLFRRHAAFFIMLVSLYWLLLLLLNLIPFIGQLASSIAIPGLSVGVMNACRELEQGRRPLPGILFSGFRACRQTLIRLGILYLTGTMLVILLSALVDGGELMRALSAGKSPMQNAEIGWAAPLMVMLLLIPLLAAFWFGPMLAAWHGLLATKALFFSLVACWLNWRAFVIYGLALALIGAIGPGFIIFVGALVLPPAAMSLLSTLLSVPLLLVLLPVVFVSFYISYREVFGVSERA